MQKSGAAPSEPLSPTALVKVKVWDLPTRMFHWLLVASVSVTLFTGFIAPEWWMGLHIFAGYAVVLLLVFRMVWGVFGSEYARLSNLARSTRYFWTYMRGLIRLSPPHYVGHNPAGSLMILAFFVVSLGLAVTGLLLEAGEEKQGPLAGLVSYAVGHGAKPVHTALAVLIIAMIAIHILGVLAESWLQNTNLTRGMITGEMPLPDGIPRPKLRPARPYAAAGVLAVVVVAVGLALTAASRLPPLGIPVMVANATHATECSACHWAYHPSLLPRASWTKLMDTLGDHFGEDASLADQQIADLRAFFNSYAAEAWDSEAGNQLRTVSPSEPTRITRSPYWIARHLEIDPASFAAPAVKGAGNCVACHRDADSGRFDDQAIDIPKGVQQ